MISIRPRFGVHFRVLGVVVGATCSAVVTAQEQSNSSGGLEEVIVTAERRVASQQDTPIAISAFGQQKLEVLGVIESGDIAAWGRNLGNEEVREFGVDFGALGFVVNTYKELRSVGVDLTYRF